jgi:predicted CXXCH cytochrome family protein
MRARAAILACCVAAAVLCGCNTASTHKVLSFFFDGVPEPGKAPAETGAKGGKGGGREGDAKAQAPAPRYKEHGPYAAKECQACHVRSTSSLILPVEELCFSCHALDVRKKYIHGPLASGGCKVCHEPHGSLYPFLLVSEPKEFCLHCHDRKAIANSGAHKDATEQCTMCHDAHSSDKAYLLK